MKLSTFNENRRNTGKIIGKINAVIKHMENIHNLSESLENMCNRTQSVANYNINSSPVKRRPSPMKPVHKSHYLNLTLANYVSKMPLQQCDSSVKQADTPYRSKLCHAKSAMSKNKNPIKKLQVLQLNLSYSYKCMTDECKDGKPLLKKPTLFDIYGANTCIDKKRKFLFGISHHNIRIRKSNVNKINYYHCIYNGIDI